MNQRETIIVCRLLDEMWYSMMNHNFALIKTMIRKLLSSAIPMKYNDHYMKIKFIISGCISGKEAEVMAIVTSKVKPQVYINILDIFHIASICTRGNQEVNFRYNNDSCYR